MRSRELFLKFKTLSFLMHYASTLGINSFATITEFIKYFDIIKTIYLLILIYIILNFNKKIFIKVVYEIKIHNANIALK